MTHLGINLAGFAHGLHVPDKSEYTCHPYQEGDEALQPFAPEPACRRSNLYDAMRGKASC